LLEVELLRNARPGGLLLRFALGALGQPLRAFLLAEVKSGARRFAAAEQIRIGDPADSGPIELGQQGAARVRPDRRDRADARAPIRTGATPARLPPWGRAP